MTVLHPLQSFTIGEGDKIMPGQKSSNWWSRTRPEKIEKSMACLMGASIKLTQHKLRVNVPEVSVHHLPGSEDVTLGT